MKLGHRRSATDESRGQRFWAAGLLLVLPLLLGAADTSSRGGALQVTYEVPEDRLLDVAIEVFDPGVPEPGTVRGKKMQSVFPKVRASEARFIPFQLQETLQSTGQWGAVRVVPAGASSMDVTISGEIVKSTGKDLVIALRVADSSGRPWMEKRYRYEADIRAYAEEQLDVGDPYHSLYGEVANDLLAARRRLDDDELTNLQRITDLRFAAELAPSAFGDYLHLNRKGRYKLNRLPADDDPMMARVATIRERDDMFVDTLNEYYADFCASMERPYDSWRSFSYEEQLALEELRRQARLRKILGALAIFGAVISDVDNSAEAAARDAAMIGGVAALQSGIAKSKEARIHVEALRELGASFESEVAPMVVEVEGETVRLTGSREDQYAAWRRLLREIHAAETGFTWDPNTATDLGLSDPTDP